MTLPKTLIASLLLGAFASAPLAAQAENACGKPWVSGYYAGFYAWQPDMQAPEHVDMTAMTHLVFARIFPKTDGTIGLGNKEAQDPQYRNLGPGAPLRTIEEYLVGRAHAVGTK
ncbi:MAG TPA: hypothetical protein VIT92_06730, partial [Burkholderiaceae bacterium]